MKTVTIISFVITLLLLLSTMICGLWIKNGNPGSLSFHMYCGIAAVICCFITFVMLFTAL